LLVDHLGWLESEGLSLRLVKLADLQRYMAAVGAEFPGPVGRPWRTGRRPYGPSTLQTLAACLKALYIYLGARGSGVELAEALKGHRLPTQADRRRLFLGHAVRQMPANPLAPARIRRRHPKLPPEGARQRLVASLPAARDRPAAGGWLARYGPGGEPGEEGNGAAASAPRPPRSG